MKIIQHKELECAEVVDSNGNSKLYRTAKNGYVYCGTFQVCEGLGYTGNTLRYSQQLPLSELLMREMEGRKVRYPDLKITIEKEQ